MKITFFDNEGNKVVFKVNAGAPTEAVCIKYANYVGRDYEVLRFFWEGCPSYQWSGKTFLSAGIEDGDVIDVGLEQKGGKPVIYIYSPTNVDATVRLSLTSEWRLSVVYPVVPITRGPKEHIEWNVRTHQDGTLTETNTGIDVAYLFWEAECIFSPFALPTY